jgi:hypothetical protein
MLVNRPNILSWFNDTIPSGYLPTAHIRNKCANSHVVWVVGERMDFIINEPIAQDGTANNVLTLYNRRNNTIVHTFRAMSQYITDEIIPKRYYNAGENCPNVPLGTYCLRFECNGTLYLSGNIDIISATEAAETTAQFRFRNTFTKNKVYYPYAPLTTFYQRFRLRCTWLSTEPRLSKEVIFDSDSNLPREFNQQETILRKLLFYQLDTNMIDGVSAMFSHDYLEINGKKYRADSAFSPQPFGRNGLANGEIVLEDLALNYFTRV